MLAKPLHETSSEFLKELLRIHAEEVRKAQERVQKFAGLAALIALGKTEDENKKIKPNCLGRPTGAKDTKPRKRRTKKELARVMQREIKPQS
jgi:hypothetical protein